MGGGLAEVRKEPEGFAQPYTKASSPRVARNMIEIGLPDPTKSESLGSVLQNAIMAFLESTEGGTLLELRRFLIEPEFRKRFLQTVKGFISKCPCRSKLENIDFTTANRPLLSVPTA